MLFVYLPSTNARLLWDSASTFEHVVTFVIITSLVWPGRKKTCYVQNLGSVKNENYLPLWWFLNNTDHSWFHVWQHRNKGHTYRPIALVYFHKEYLGHASTDTCALVNGQKQCKTMGWCFHHWCKLSMDFGTLYKNILYIEWGRRKEYRGILLEWWNKTNLRYRPKR